MLSQIIIRKAIVDDAEAIIQFNKSMALETESLILDDDIISKGVRHILSNPNSAFYIVAELNNKIIASLMITTEWSDWRNGFFWWIQSVYVVSEFRRKGIYKKLYNFVKELSESKEDVIGFRLYVELNNIIAINTYKSLGMNETHYRLYEELIAK